MNDDDLDFDVDGELGFGPAVSATGADTGTAKTATANAAADDATKPKTPTRRTRSSGPRSAMRRRVGASVVLLAALTTMGGVYASFAASSGATSSTASDADIAAGRQIYQNSCISCHGANLEGVNGQGPSLIGVGQAATYFQVITGRMPVAGQGAYIARKEPKFTEAQIEKIAAYVESIGGGPSVPHGNLRGANDQLGDGGVLYRLNCASCHGVTGKGAPLSAGKIAPSLNVSSDKELYAAMLSGPESMPVFGDSTITPEQKKSIIAYVQTLKASQDPGGAGVDRIGPVSEAIVIWVGGVGALMVAILWIGARSR